MSQIRNKTEIKQSLMQDNNKIKKSMPNFFNTYDEIQPGQGLLISVGIHVVLTIIFIIFGAILAKVNPSLPKPKMVQDVEFKLVQNESKKPINKKTPNRSDRDSRAGGKHDPKRVVQEPSPAPKAQNQQKAQPKQPQKPQQPQKVAQKPQPKVQTPPKTVTKPQPKTQPMAKPAPVKKPAPIKAPVASKPAVVPAFKPNTAPSAPKLATAPKSPFMVTVPPSKAPVGPTYKPQAGTTATKPSTSGGSTSGGSNLAPKFSASKTGTGSSGGGNLAYRPTGGGSTAYRGTGGSGGHGTSGNPSPGNPRGTPGIDAIRQPNWGPYMRDLEQRIKRNWAPPKGDSSKRVVITFTIARDGRLLSKSVSKSSGVPLADRAAMAAIEATAPFRPLPPEFKGQSVPIEFTFDYNVLNGAQLK